MPEGETRAVWKDQLSEIQQELRLATESMLDKASPVQKEPCQTGKSHPVFEIPHLRAKSDALESSASCPSSKMRAAVLIICQSYLRDGRHGAKHCEAGPWDTASSSRFLYELDSLAFCRLCTAI